MDSSSDTETPLEEDASSLLPAQSKTMLHFFKPVEQQQPTSLRRPKKSVEQKDKKRKKVCCETSEPESTPAAKTKKHCSPGIMGSFFKPISKEEYRKEQDQRLAELATAVITVKAMVHSPTDSTCLQMSKCDKNKVKSRRGSNVSRASDETDVIQVIEEECSGKISSKLFLGNKRPREEDKQKAAAYPEDSVDVDFFDKMMPDEEELVLDTPNASPDKKIQKVSTQLFSKKHKRTAAAADVRKVDYDSDIDIPSTRTSLFKTKEAKPKKRGKKMQSAVQYDSDSIDVDVLATFSAKTFCQSSSSPPCESDTSESSNAFSVLMKKPLSRNPKQQQQQSPSSSPSGSSLKRTDEEKVSPMGNKENELVIPADKNAFTKLMCGKVEAAEKEKNSKSEKEVEVVENEKEDDKKATFSTKLLVCETEKEDKIILCAGKKTEKKDLAGVETQVEDDKSAAFTTKLVVSETEKEDKMSAGKKSEKEDKMCGNKKSEKEDKMCGKKSEKEDKMCGKKSEKEEKMSAGKKSEKEGKMSGKKTEKEDKMSDKKSEKEDKMSAGKKTEKEVVIMSGQKSEKEDLVVVEKVVKKKRGRKRKEASKPPLEAEKEQLDNSSTLVDCDGETVTTRRSSSRIKRNREINEARLKEDSSRWKKSKEEINLDDDDDEDDDIKVDKIVVMKSNKKLASIFINGRKANAIKVIEEEDPAKVAARKAFLLSSVPDTLRSQIMTSQDEHCNNGSSGEAFASTETLAFSSRIGHVNQIDEADNYWALPRPERMGRLNAKLRKFEQDYYCGPTLCTQKAQLLTKDDDEDRVVQKEELQRLNGIQIYMKAKCIKACHKESFSTTKVFRRYLERKIESDTLEEEARSKNVNLNEIEEERLRGGRRRRRRQKSGEEKCVVVSSSKVVQYNVERPSSMQWTMKYAPRSAEDIIGNLCVVQQLKSWLGEWEARDLKRRRQTLNDSCGSSGSSSTSDFWTSSDDEEEDEDLPNTALLVGPSGVGKTASIYALAHEMGFKVLEVNASSSRNGKQVLANLREATQSHDVRKKRDVMMKKKSHVVDKTALILFEDIDVVFGDADEGFYAAVNSLIGSTKRPIILTTSNATFPKKKKCCSKLLKVMPQTFTFKQVRPELLAKHLQLLALVEGYSVDLQSLVSMCQLLKGSVSKAMLDLQYWTMSGGGHLFFNETVVENCEGDHDDNMIQKLMGLKISKIKALNKEEVVVKTLKGSEMFVMGLGNFNSMGTSRELTQSWTVASALFSHGFGHVYDSNSRGGGHLILPPCKKKNRPDEDLEKNKSNKIAFGKAIELMSKCAEAASHFLLLPDYEEEIMQYVQWTTTAQTAKALAELLPPGQTKRLKLLTTTAYEEHANEEEVHQDVAESVMHEPNISRTLHLDVMPALRGMAKSEEKRRLNKIGGDGSSSSKRSRSSRFLHYFDTQEICLKQNTLNVLCNEMKM